MAGQAGAKTPSAPVALYSYDKPPRGGERMSVYATTAFEALYVLQKSYQEKLSREHMQIKVGDHWEYAAA